MAMKEIKRIPSPSLQVAILFFWLFLFSFPGNASPETTAADRNCPDCSGHVVFLEGATFSSGTSCQCIASSRITFGKNVRVEKGATLTVNAPIVQLTDGFHVEAEATVHMVFVASREPLWGWGITTGILGNQPNDRPPDPDVSDSQCNQETTQPNPGFSCPHLMLMSMDMELAAQRDGNDWAHYAVAGLGTDSECGRCYQLDFRAPENSSFPGGFGISPGGLPEKPLIIQAANSGGDVSSGQFDIYMGAGGFGANNACSADCDTNQCCGTPCKGNQYEGTCHDFTLGNSCYGGGIRIDHLNTVNLTPEEACEKAAPGDDWVSVSMRYSCIQSTRRKYHWNWRVAWAEVECPDSLIRATGLMRKNNVTSGLPKPSETLLDGKPINGWTTSMEDCCKPSCGWSGKGDPDGKWSATMTCGKNGQPYLK